MKKRLINSHTLFIATLVVIPTLVLIVFLTGLQQHRSLYLNSLVSTTIISFMLLVFMTAGLYNAWKLKDTIGKLYKKPDFKDLPDAGEFGGFDVPEAGDGIAGIIVAILLWIAAAILAIVIFYLVTTIVWLSILAVGSVLYWMVFRAFRLVFKKGAWCKGNMVRSFSTALLYTFFYNCWIYAIIICVHFLHNN